MNKEVLIQSAIILTGVALIWFIHDNVNAGKGFKITKG